MACTKQIKEHLERYGGIITTQPVNYRFVSVFDNKEIRIKAYPMETILSE
ncbi:MAG: hypothetical protein WCY62_05155 [Clostridia bacterium]|jgi:hypothetical protein